MIMDYLALPPEINSARMYAGPGAAPLIAAATAWGSLAAELGTTSASISQVASGLGALWLGPSSLAFTAAIHQYTSWLTLTAERAQQTAAQAMQAVGAYEAAFAATVPPPIIAANRTLLATLVATNFLGINTAAIAATEAHYAEMWAQDIAAMVGYQAASAQATAPLTPDTPLTSSVHPIGIPSSISFDFGNVRSILAGLAGLNIFAPGSNTETGGLAGILNLFSGSTNSALGSFLNSNFVSTGLINSAFSSGFYYQIPQSFVSVLMAGVALGQTDRQIQIGMAGLPNDAQQALVNPGVSQVDPGSGQPVQASMGTSSQVGGLSAPSNSWVNNGTINNEAPNANLNGAVKPINNGPNFAMPYLPMLGRIQPGAKNNEQAKGDNPRQIINRHPSGG